MSIHLARGRLRPLLLSAGALALAAPAMAETPAEPRPSVSRKAAVSSNSTINLVNLLVKQGVLTQEQADGLIKQAEDEAYVARQAARDANAKAEEAARQAGAAQAAASPPGTKRVTYVPDYVKKQIRDEIREEVMSKAEKEGWASPGKYPEWAERIRFFGDMRARYEMVSYPKGNAPDFVNFGAINGGAPYDVSPANTAFPPYFNTAEDRNRFRLRARVGLEADVTENFTAGFRIATGENNSPVSTNQSFGANGGDFSKYALWLDRAYVAWRPFDSARVVVDDGLVSKLAAPRENTRELTIYFGRFDNPFFTNTELVWDSDLGFDGVAAKASYELSNGLRPFVAAGAFPIYNTDLNAGFNLDQDNNFPSKSKSHDKYLFGGQLGLGGQVAEDYSFKVAASFFDFSNVKGKLSSPCFVSSASTVCDTDITRPSFAQKGNTYRPLRNIVPYEGNDFGQSNQYQYYGLASDFRTLVLAGQIDLARFDPIHVTLDGEFVKNLAFNKSQVSKVAVNNLGPVDANGDSHFVGGDTGWAAMLTVGHKEIKKLWDWKVHVGYRRLESDATVDAFTDSDFGLGGTNLKGYTIGGSLGLADNVWASAKWMSADSVAGAPYSVDILQLDLNAKF
ncbi:MAG: hypothetical protein DI534_10500 [Leifsonia xyli]|nr:MAG: hypothetical protein DI534_10500 [Leifsonia xyli]